MAASLTKTQSYAASQYAAQTSGNALTVTLVTDDYLWIRQTLETTDDSVTPTLTEMVLEATGPETVAVSISSGAYVAGTEITLSYSDPTATIYYTTDGTDPDNTDTEYTTAITVGNFTLKSIAYVGGVADCAISSATYTVAAAPTYSVTYNGNGNDGGAVPTDATDYEETDTVTVLGNTGSLTKTGYRFTGWNTAANGTGTGYVAGGTFAMGTANVTLYAVWSAMPTVTTSAATDVNSRSAILQGSLTGLGDEASVDVYFEYGTTTSYGSTTDALTLSATGSFSARPTDLDEETEYHFRAVALVGTEETYGADTGLTTLACPFNLTAAPALTSIYWSWDETYQIEWGDYLRFYFSSATYGYLDSGVQDLVPIRDSFSMMFWLKYDISLVDTANRASFIYESDDPLNKRYHIGIESNGQLIFTRTPKYFYDDYVIAKTAIGAFPNDNAFHKVVILKDTTDFTFYIDDVEYPNIGDPPDNTSTGYGDPSTFRIGVFRLNTVPLGFKGIKIWNRKITGSEITAELLDPIGAGALLWYKFDEGSGSAIIDYSGNGYHGTLHNEYEWISGS